LAAGCGECQATFQRLLDLQARWGYWDAAVIVFEAAIVEDQLRILLEASSSRARAALIQSDPDLPGWCLAVRLSS
jgi:hypothetical protein